ncbi:MAG: permease [Candidatus Aminicenantes bacterium]|nr:permease [Candidatus Aminicenantes bacterium]
MSRTDWKTEWKPLLFFVFIFLGVFYLPLGVPRFDNAFSEALYLLKEYAQEHVLTCLLPAFFIAGAIAVFISQASVMKYFGAKAKKVMAYSVASVSGSILAVCSCTVLPLFAGITRMGAGLGPASTFLYSGPAINILAIILTAKVLGPELGIARAVGAVVFSVVIGLLMHFFFRKEEMQKAEAQAALPEPEESRPLWRTALYFAVMVGILVFANWGKPEDPSGFWLLIFSLKWYITAAFALMLSLLLTAWFRLSWLKVILAAVPPFFLALAFPHNPFPAFAAGIIGLSIITSTDKGESGDWFTATWGFTKQILPLLFFGILIAGFFLGRPGHEGIIPSNWVSSAVGGNSLWANLFASVAGAFMYFATLTEVPILQGLIGSGMGKGPALALLLAGPALSLPNMLVIRSVIGTKKTAVFVLLVILLSTAAGLLFGTFF